MQEVAPGESRPITLTNLPPGLVGTLGVRLEDSANNILQARTTEGVVEFAVGNYRKWITLPTQMGWVYVIADDEGVEAVEEFKVTGTPNAPSDWRPTVSQVAAILRARTYSKGVVDPENPMAALAGGELLGEFTAGTRPTSAQVEELIDLAVADVSMRVGVELPELLRASAQRVTALRAASEAERSYLAEGSNPAESIYQTLRMTFEEEVAQLARNVQWHSLSGFMEKLPDR